MDTTGFWETLNEESISLGRLKQWQAPFSVVAGYIEMLDQKLFREFDMGLQVVDLLEDAMDAVQEGDTMPLTMKPFEIKTVKVWY